MARQTTDPPLSKSTFVGVIPHTVGSRNLPEVSLTIFVRHGKKVYLRVNVNVNVHVPFARTTKARNRRLREEALVTQEPESGSFRNPPLRGGRFYTTSKPPLATFPRPALHDGGRVLGWEESGNLLSNPLRRRGYVR